MAKKVKCPKCGSDLVDSNYNYETSHTDHKCEECGNTFTESDLHYCEDCGCQIIDIETFVLFNDILCEDCYNKRVSQYAI